VPDQVPSNPTTKAAIIGVSRVIGRLIGKFLGSRQAT